MKVLRNLTLAAIFAAAAAMTCAAQGFKITEGEYYRNGGVDVMAFDDLYPEGHQGGISLIMHGKRIATNGDIRMEATPGQWQPVSKELSRKIDGQTIETTLCFPDSSRHMTGFNPMIYPDYNVTYKVRIRPVGRGLEIVVDLDTPVPDALLGKVGFNLELYPGELLGKPWLMDDQGGIYPAQANSPLLTTTPNYLHTGDYHMGGSKADWDILVKSDEYNPIIADDIIAEPYAVGHKFTSCPDDPYSRFTVESETNELKLFDGRMNHNNGWFVLRSEIAAGATKEAVKWTITPNVVSDWMYKPVIQTSQVGYHPAQSKVAVIELDARDSFEPSATLVKMTADGEKTVKDIETRSWGKFLRYNYLQVDFSDVTEAGMYKVKYRDSESPVFKIGEDVYKRGVWQPVLEYFLPIQMCHMRVTEKYRVWHDLCHMDDARMAPVFNHIDGYTQEETLPDHPAGEVVEGLNVGGWHDAGDYDLMLSSQQSQVYLLALTYENFHPDIDVTTIDQKNHSVEIHQPDGQNDVLQQLEHGVLTLIGGYKAFGKFYRGIICHELRQYVLLGDAGAMTDGISGNDDDRWVFTQEEGFGSLSAVGALAAAARNLKGYNDDLAQDCLNIAEAVFARVEEPQSGDQMRGPRGGMKLQPAVELYLTTGKDVYRQYILDQKEQILRGVDRSGWYLTRVMDEFAKSKNKKERAFAQDFKNALAAYASRITEQASESPYGVPYHPQIWGAGWTIQGFGFYQYFLAKAYPDIFSKEPIFSALNFVLGCHPGSNQASFASGVGSKSATTAYGNNRADWSYIPGGVVSGTGLVRPDFPELLEFPYIWQQAEYQIGGACNNYMFLVLAADSLLEKE